MKTFDSVTDLFNWLTENQKLVLFSQPKKLRERSIFLQSIASGDFNPAHCLPTLRQTSIFKTLVSQGIGIVARAEGEFLQLLRFVTPPEVIALGLDNLSYSSPLGVGNTYQYVYE